MERQFTNNLRKELKKQGKKLYELESEELTGESAVGLVVQGMIAGASMEYEEAFMAVEAAWKRSRAWLWGQLRKELGIGYANLYQDDAGKWRIEASSYRSKLEQLYGEKAERIEKFLAEYEVSRSTVRRMKKQVKEVIVPEEEPVVVVAEESNVKRVWGWMAFCWSKFWIAKEPVNEGRRNFLKGAAATAASLIFSGSLGEEKNSEEIARGERLVLGDRERQLVNGGSQQQLEQTEVISDVSAEETVMPIEVSNETVVETVSQEPLDETVMTQEIDWGQSVTVGFAPKIVEMASWSSRGKASVQFATRLVSKEWEGYQQDIEWLGRWQDDPNRALVTWGMDCRNAGFVAPSGEKWSTVVMGHSGFDQSWRPLPMETLRSAYENSGDDLVGKEVIFSQAGVTKKSWIVGIKSSFGESMVFPVDDPRAPQRIFVRMDDLELDRASLMPGVVHLMLCDGWDGVKWTERTFVSLVVENKDNWDWSRKDRNYLDSGEISELDRKIVELFHPGVEVEKYLASIEVRSGPEMDNYLSHTRLGSQASTPMDDGVEWKSVAFHSSVLTDQGKVTNQDLRSEELLQMEIHRKLMIPMYHWGYLGWVGVANDEASLRMEMDRGNMRAFVELIQKKWLTKEIEGLIDPYSYQINNSEWMSVDEAWDEFCNEVGEELAVEKCFDPIVIMRINDRYFERTGKNIWDIVGLYRTNVNQDLLLQIDAR